MNDVCTVSLGTCDTRVPPRPPPFDTCSELVRTTDMVGRLVVAPIVRRRFGVPHVLVDSMLLTRTSGEIAPLRCTHGPRGDLPSSVCAATTPHLPFEVHGRLVLRYGVVMPPCLHCGGRGSAGGLICAKCGGTGEDADGLVRRFNDDGLTFEAVLWSDTRSWVIDRARESHHPYGRALVDVFEQARRNIEEA